MLVTTDGSLRRPTGFRSQSISVIMMDVVHSSHICVTENRNKNEKTNESPCRLRYNRKRNQDDKIDEDGKDAKRNYGLRQHLVRHLVVNL